VCKFLKPTIKSLAQSDTHFSVVLQLLNCVDDVVLLEKMVVSELMDVDAEILFGHENCIKILLFGLSGRMNTKKYLGPFITSKLNEMINVSDDGQIKQMKPYKKDEIVKHYELLSLFVLSLASQIESVEQISQLLRHTSAGQIIYEIIKKTHLISHKNDYNNESIMEVLCMFLHVKRAPMLSWY